jgi:hypothetical protein
VPAWGGIGAVRVLVTGGAGFIGSCYVRTLLAGGYLGFEDAEVTVFDKLTYAGNLANLAPVADSLRYRFVRGDICSAADLARALVHLETRADAPPPLLPLPEQRYRQLVRPGPCGVRGDRRGSGPRAAEDIRRNGPPGPRPAYSSWTCRLGRRQNCPHRGPGGPPCMRHSA